MTRCEYTTPMLAMNMAPAVTPPARPCMRRSIRGSSTSGRHPSPLASAPATVYSRTTVSRDTTHPSAYCSIAMAEAMAATTQPPRPIDASAPDARWRQRAPGTPTPSVGFDFGNRLRTGRRDDPLGDISSPGHITGQAIQRSRRYPGSRHDLVQGLDGNWQPAHSQRCVALRSTDSTSRHPVQQTNGWERWRGAHLSHRPLVCDLRHRAEAAPPTETVIPAWPAGSTAFPPASRTGRRR